MLEGSTDLMKRKPRRLRGTPANKVATLISVVIVSVVTGGFYLYNESDSEWSRERKRRLWERVAPKEREFVRREMFKDPLFGMTVNLLNERVAARECLENEKKISAKDEPKTVD